MKTLSSALFCSTRVDIDTGVGFDADVRFWFEIDAYCLSLGHHGCVRHLTTA